MRRKDQERVKDLRDLEETRRYSVVIVEALAEKIGRFAARYGDLGPIQVDVDDLNAGVMALQSAMGTALMELNNAVVNEDDARH